MTKKILISGSLAYDRIMDFNGFFKDHILPEKIHILNVSFYVEKLRQSFGGTSANIAYSLALLGEKPIVLSAYGNDFTLYKSWCRKYGLNVSYAKPIKNVQTSSAYIITDQANNQITGFFAGAMQYSNGSIPRKLLGPGSLSVVAPGNVQDLKNYPKI